MYGLDIPTNSTNIGLFVLAGILLNLQATSLGYFAGVLFDTDDAARMLAVFAILVFMLTCGVLSNASTNPAFITALSYVSPMRYAVEIFFRRVSAGEAHMILVPSTGETY